MEEVGKKREPSLFSMRRGWRWVAGPVDCVLSSDEERGQWWRMAAKPLVLGLVGEVPNSGERPMMPLPMLLGLMACGALGWGWGCWPGIQSASSMLALSRLRLAESRDGLELPEKAASRLPLDGEMETGSERAAVS